VDSRQFGRTRLIEFLTSLETTVSRRDRQRKVVLPVKESKFILGIDAAWTTVNPSGVALLEVQIGRQPRLIHASPSYDAFIRWEPIDWDVPVHGSSPDMGALINKCEEKGFPVSVVALDIPLSPYPITGRRAADNKVSESYGARKASTHSPSATRPGRASSQIFDQLVRSGCKCARDSNSEGRTFLEVYPHVAIIEFFSLPERLKYKVSRHRRYWPELSSQESRHKVNANLRRLEEMLEGRVIGVHQIIPDLNPDLRRGLSHLKKLEDVLDAIVCALVGASYLKGKAYPMGDETGAIWVPVT